MKNRYTIHIYNKRDKLFVFLLNYYSPQTGTEGREIACKHHTYLIINGTIDNDVCSDTLISYHAYSYSCMRLADVKRK